MEAKHTPGPWHFHQSGDPDQFTILKPQKKEDVLIGTEIKLADMKHKFRWLMAISQNGEKWTEEQVANLHLVCAAPEMAKELLSAYQLINSGLQLEGDDLDRIRKVLTKAGLNP